MAMRYPALLVLLSLSAVTAEQKKDAADASNCGREEKGSKSFTLSLSGWRNSTGYWVAEVSARKEVSSSTRNVSVEVEHRIFECNGKTVILMKGRQLFGDDGNHGMEELLFNERHGKNALLLNGGRSAYRNNPEPQDGHGTLFSSRPLKDNELFEIRVESKISKWGGNSIGIGVTAFPVSSFNSTTLWMMDVKYLTWMLYNNNVYVDGSVKKNGYGKNLSSLVVGDKVGVTRTSNGDLHFFVNGVDQGIAASGIPRDVHAVVDVIRDFVAVAIV